MKQVWELLAETGLLFLRLLAGPPDSIFKKNAQFGPTFPKVVRIIFLAALLTLAIILNGPAPALLLQALPKYALIAFTALLLLTLFFLPIAWLSRLRITQVQVFATFGLILAPWAPVFVLTDKLGGFHPVAGPGLLISLGFPILAVWALTNLIRAIAKVSGASVVHAALPIIVPLALISSLLYLLWRT